MEQFRASGFVAEDSLALSSYAGVIRLKGEIACLGEIVVYVDKLIEERDDGPDPLICTFKYTYNAWVRGHQSFMRVDNAHPHPGHQDEHHRHKMDWRTGEELPGSPAWVGVAGWPTLGEFLDDVQRWFWEHRGSLPNPDSHPQLGMRSE